MNSYLFRFTILWALLAIYPSISEAQNLTFFGVVPQWNQTGRLSQKFNYNMVLYPTIDAFRETYNGVQYPARALQLYVQPSILYRINNQLTISAGYIYQRNNPFEGSYINEHRPFEQLNYNIPLKKGTITNRLRLEERFIENRATNTYPNAIRLRYQIGFQLPFKGNTIEKNEFYLNATNEWYFSLTGIKNATFSEDWTYAGIGYHLGEMGRLEMGYLLQTQVRDVAQDLRFLHLLQVSLITNFDFFKSFK